MLSIVILEVSTMYHPTPLQNAQLLYCDTVLVCNSTVQRHNHNHIVKFPTAKLRTPVLLHTE